MYQKINKLQLLILAVLVSALFIPFHSYAQERILWTSIKKLFTPVTEEILNKTLIKNSKLKHADSVILHRNSTFEVEIHEQILFIGIKNYNDEIGSLAVIDGFNFENVIKEFPRLDNESESEWATRIGLLVEPKIVDTPSSISNQFSFIEKNETLGEWKERQYRHLQKFIIDESYFGYNHRIAHKIEDKSGWSYSLNSNLDQLKSLEYTENLNYSYLGEFNSPIYFNKSPALFAVVPNPKSGNLIDQYKNIYEKDYVTRTEINNINKLAEELSGSSENVHLLPENKGRFIQGIKDSNRNFIVILGHNEINRSSLDPSLRFANGETISANSLHNICKGFGKRCAILTCYGDDFSANESISQREIIYMWKRGLNWFENQQNDEILIEDFILEMRKARLDLKNKYRIILVTTAVGVGGSAIIIINRVDH